MAPKPESQTIAVTGAGGFIGSHLTHALLRAGYRVRALVRYGSAGSIGHLAEVIEEAKRLREPWREESRLKIVHGDVTDARCVREFVRQCDVVMHLAALIGIPYSYRAPASYVNVNVLGALNVLEACRDECPERVILTSTSEVYGTAREVPMRERHRLQAQSPYAASKIAQDKLAESYARSFNLPALCLRPFNTYGPRQSTRAVIPTILAQGISDRCETIRLGNLAAIRDMTYVEDTAQAFIALAQAPLDKVSGRVFNCGTGTGQSVEELAALACKLLNITKPIETEEGRKRPPRSEVDRLIADTTRLREATGWESKTMIAEGMARTAQWLKRNIHLIDPSTYTV